MKEISSPDNPKVKTLTALSQKKQRDKQERYVIEGPNLLREALKNFVRPELVFFRRSALQKESRSGPGQPTGLQPGDYEYGELLRALEEMGAGVGGYSRQALCSGEPRGGPEILSLPDELFDRMAQTDTPQGVMAVVKKRCWTEEEFFGGGAAVGDGRKTADEAGSGNVLVLDRLQDPGNLGTVLRTAHGAGFLGAILMKGCGDLFSPKVVRACAGTLFRIPVLYCETPGEAVALLHKYNKKVYATSLQNSRVYYECDLRRDTALVIGNEGNGVCEKFLAEADGLLTIPMAGNLESLNAAVAAGILMYETVRQRNGG